MTPPRAKTDPIRPGEARRAFDHGTSHGS